MLNLFHFWTRQPTMVAKYILNYLPVSFILYLEVSFNIDVSDFHSLINMIQSSMNCILVNSYLVNS